MISIYLLNMAEAIYDVIYMATIFYFIENLPCLIVF